MLISVIISSKIGSNGPHHSATLIALPAIVSKKKNTNPNTAPTIKPMMVFAKIVPMVVLGGTLSRVFVMCFSGLL